MKTLAELIGAAITRARDLKELSDASQIIENSPVLLYRLGAQPPYPLIYLSRNISRYGYSAADLLAAPADYVELFHPDDRRDLKLDTMRVVSGQVESVSRERRVRTADDRYVWFETTARALHDDKHDAVFIEGILIDINERKSAEAKLAQVSSSDPVTGLANRKAFMEELGRSFADARRTGAGFAIHYVDLDRFKDVNDVLGHSEGDKVLQLVATRLNGLRQAGARTIARFGGDEFAILQTDVNEASDASAFAAQIVRQLARPYRLNTEIHLTASIGIAVFAPDVSGPEDMIKRADVALYRAKELGRNQFHFHSEALDAAVVERVVLGGDLRRALDRGELELHYQPQVDLETRQIVGLEALARWHHPTLGLLSPSRFIPIAERNGTILTLGRWVIDEVCRQIAAWRGEQLITPRIAINVSAAQFKAVPGFDQEVAERLKHWDVEPSSIELELTESVLMETTRQHGEAIDRLRALGIAIAIDDFGTGYSSLGYLRAYHVNHIKIAQEFIRNIEVGTGDVAIVRAALSLGRELGIAVIAEGVETKKQLDILTAAGCRYVQGFYFSHPLSPRDTADLLRRGTCDPCTAEAAKELQS